MPRAPALTSLPRDIGGVFRRTEAALGSVTALREMAEASDSPRVAAFIYGQHDEIQQAIGATRAAISPIEHEFIDAHTAEPPTGAPKLPSVPSVPDCWHSAVLRMLEAFLSKCTRLRGVEYSDVERNGSLWWKRMRARIRKFPKFDAATIGAFLRREAATVARRRTDAGRRAAAAATSGSPRLPTRISWPQAPGNGREPALGTGGPTPAAEPKWSKAHYAADVAKLFGFNTRQFGTHCKRHPKTFQIDRVNKVKVRIRLDTLQPSDRERVEKFEAE